MVIEETEEKLYQILRGDLVGSMWGFICDNLKDEEGLFYEDFNKKVITCLSTIGYVKRDLEKYKPIWIRFAKNENLKLIKELGIQKIKPYVMGERIKNLLDNGKLWDYTLDELNKKHIGDREVKELLLLCSVGRLLKKRKPYSFNVLLLTASSSGKDHVIKAVLKLFEKYEVWEKYNRISETALNYLHAEQEGELDPFNWSGKILYLPEITNKVLNNAVMKEFTAGDDAEEISEIAITKRKTKGIDFIKIHGKPEVFSTTAKTIPEEEIRNRYSIVCSDESDEQTELTFGFEEREIDKELIEYLGNMKPQEIDIPQKMKNFIIKVFPKDKPRYRRDFPKLIDFIKAFALFHNHKRAEPEDYNRAKDVFVNSFSSASKIPLKDIDKEIIEVLKKHEKGLQAREIHKEIENGEKYTLKTIYNHIARLEEKEIIIGKEERLMSGYFITKIKLTKAFIDDKPFELPDYEE